METIRIYNQSIKKVTGMTKDELKKRVSEGQLIFACEVIKACLLYDTLFFTTEKNIDGRCLKIISINKDSLTVELLEKQKDEDEEQPGNKIQENFVELQENLFKLQKKSELYDFEYIAKQMRENEETIFFITPRNEPFNILFKTKNIDGLPTLKAIYDLHKKATVKELEDFIKRHDDFKNAYLIKPCGNEEEFENVFHKRIDETEYYFFQSVSYSRKHVYYKQEIKINKRIGTIRDVKKLIDLLSK